MRKIIFNAGAESPVEFDCIVFVVGNGIKITELAAQFGVRNQTFHIVVIAEFSLVVEKGLPVGSAPFAPVVNRFKRVIIDNVSNVPDAVFDYRHRFSPGKRISYATLKAIKNLPEKGRFFIGLGQERRPCRVGAFARRNNLPFVISGQVDGVELNR